MAAGIGAIIINRLLLEEGVCCCGRRRSRSRSRRIIIITHVSIGRVGSGMVIGRTIIEGSCGRACC